jgi:hypothetical protein
MAWALARGQAQPRKQCSGDMFWAWLPAGDSVDEPASVFFVLQPTGDSLSNSPHVHNYCHLHTLLDYPNK